MSKHSAGKGSKYRLVNKKQYDKNYDAIFNKPKKKKLYQTKHTLCYELYEKGGADAVVDYCISIDHGEWAYCPDCEQVAPIDMDVPLYGVIVFVFICVDVVISPLDNNSHFTPEA